MIQKEYVWFHYLIFPIHVEANATLNGKKSLDYI